MTKRLQRCLKITGPASRISFLTSIIFAETVRRDLKNSLSQVSCSSPRDSGPRGEPSHSPADDFQTSTQMSMFTRPKVLVCAYVVDRDDVSEAQMAYEWISRIARAVDVVVVSAGSRKRALCRPGRDRGIRLEIVSPRVSFRKWDAFDRIVHPGYVEFFWEARKRIRALLARRRIHLGHHLTPQALRYPSPMSGFPLPIVAGPYHGGLQPPPVMRASR